MIDKTCNADRSQTALHLAVQGNVEAAKVLLEEGNANPLALTRRKETPLHLAAIAGKIGLVRLLSQKRSRTVRSSSSSSAGTGVTSSVRGLNCRNVDGDTPFELAIRYGHYEVADLLSQNVAPNCGLSARLGQRKGGDFHLYKDTQAG